METTPTLAEILVQVANGDVDKLAKLREICSWFPNRAMLYEKLLGIALAATMEITPAQAEIFIQVAYGDVDKLAKLREI